MLGAGVATAAMFVVPPGGDASAHLYRSLLVRLGVVVWDNLWYAGHYPLASYSLLYYWPSALIGNTVVAVVAVGSAAALFASLTTREWGSTAYAPAALFALVAGLVPLTGEYPFLCGIATAFGVLVLLQRDRTASATLIAALTAGFSSLAFAFLLLVLVSIGISRHTLGRRWFVVGLVAVCCVAAAESLTFGVAWTGYPFPTGALLRLLEVAAVGAALSWRTARGHVLGTFFLVWAAAGTLLYALPTPIGGDIWRPREFVFPLVVLAAVLGRTNWRLLVAVAISLAAVFNLSLYQPSLVGALTGGSLRASLWAPALSFLGRHRVMTIGFRIEVVPTAGHWEAYYLPRAGYALARGWYRQLDLASNPILYQPTLTPAAYQGWLRELGVRYVLLPSRIAPDGLGAIAERRLLRSGRSGLAEVFGADGWSIFELSRATPILTGHAPARITTFRHDRIAGWVAGSGRFQLRVRYMPFWQATAGAVCVEPGPAGMSTLFVVRPGRFALAASEPLAIFDRDRRCSERFLASRSGNPATTEGRDSQRARSSRESFPAPQP
jgi:hypothetical protein